VISNVSFIVIARNESFAIKKCLESIAALPLKGCEVICVDCDSTDDTLKNMGGYVGKIENLRIVRCSGYVNAAVARNAGMNYATKEYIFFVDGDVALYPEFIAVALSRIQEGKADAVTGRLMEIQYSPDYKKELRRIVRRKQITEETECFMTGGIFIVTRKIVEMVGAWNESYFRFQDMNYTLRISRIGAILQLPEFIGIHHSQEFCSRDWEHFMKGYPSLYGRLICENLDRPLVVLRLVRANSGLSTFLLISSIVLLSSLAAAALTSFIFPAAALIAALCVVIDCAFSILVRRFKITQWLLHHYLSPFLMLFGFFQRPPHTKKQTQVDVVV
jgi:glycosyltransferase involved in cell wall biosynthesis